MGDWCGYSSLQILDAEVNRAEKKLTLMVDTATDSGHSDSIPLVADL